MKKTMLAVLLSAFLCNAVFADEQKGDVEQYSEILAQESNSDNELLEHESIDPESIDAEYVEPEYVEVEYIEENYEAAVDASIEETLEVSSQDNLLSILESCKEYTLEDGVEAKDLNSYLLICINNILNENGYKSVKSVPVE